jgi:hypothetical protein
MPETTLNQTPDMLRAALRWLHLAGAIVWLHADPRRRVNGSEEIEHPRDPEAIHENTPQTERSQIVDDDIIFVDPTWLCSLLMGRIMAKRALLEAQGIDVPWHDHQFVLAVPDLDPIGRDMGIAGPMIAHLLEHFGVGRCIEDRVLIPARLTAGISDETRKFLVERSECILGRELVARPPNVFVPGFLSLLQLKAFERGASLWKGGLMLMSKSGDKNLVATIEALELYEDARVEDTHITRLLVCVYSNCTDTPDNNPMTEILEECLTLIRFTLRELVPSLRDVRSRVHVYASGPGCVLARLRQTDKAAACGGTPSSTHTASLVA